jgi:hypothetical protein
VKAIHAGLECGIIGEKYPGIDMVSFGPTLEGVHSPDEKIHLDTVPKFYRFLVPFLRKTQKGDSPLFAVAAYMTAVGGAGSSARPALDSGT